MVLRHVYNFVPSAFGIPQRTRRPNHNSAAFVLKTMPTNSRARSSACAPCPACSLAKSRHQPTTVLAQPIVSIPSNLVCGQSEPQTNLVGSIRARSRKMRFNSGYSSVSTSFVGVSLFEGSARVPCVGGTIRYCPDTLTYNFDPGCAYRSSKDRYPGISTGMSVPPLFSWGWAK